MLARARRVRDAAFCVLIKMRQQRARVCVCGMAISSEGVTYFHLLIIRQHQAIACVEWYIYACFSDLRAAKDAGYSFFAVRLCSPWGACLTRGSACAVPPAVRPPCVARSAAHARCSGCRSDGHSHFYAL